MGISASKRPSLLNNTVLTPCYKENSVQQQPISGKQRDHHQRWTRCQGYAEGGVDMRIPTPRSGHTVAVVGQKAYLFGGCGRAQGLDDRCLNDLYAFDLERLTWEKIIIPAGEVRPAVRRSAAMCPTGAGKFVIVGGAGDDPDHLRSDMFEFDTQTRRWRKLVDDSCATPFRLCGQSVCCYEGRLIFFGGSTGLEYSDALHEYNPVTDRWRVLEAKGTAPSPRYKHQAFIHGKSMYIIGGGSFKPQCKDIDVYQLNLETMEWRTVVDMLGAVPRARVAHSCSYDAEAGAVFVWGGFTAELQCLRNFHRLDLDTMIWTAIKPQRHEMIPAARSFHASAFYRGSVYVFSGSNGMDKFSDVWRYVVRSTPPSLLTLAARVVVANHLCGAEPTRRASETTVRAPFSDSPGPSAVSAPAPPVPGPECSSPRSITRRRNAKIWDRRRSASEVSPAKRPLDSAKAMRRSLPLHPYPLAFLPEELQEALRNLDPQADCIV